LGVSAPKSFNHAKNKSFSANLFSSSRLDSVFEKVRLYFGAQSESIPMSFVLGFYVSLVVKRWWEQYKLLPWPDTLALFISAAIPGNVSFYP
jgi:Bestrophin, RFP-TM, chloride channel